MRLNVAIRVINPVRTGVSQASGREWKNQDVVVAWTEKLPSGHDYENVQMFTMHGASVDKFQQMNPQVGMQIFADLAFGTRVHNGRVYNENSLYL